MFDIIKLSVVTPNFTLSNDHLSQTHILSMKNLSLFFAFIAFVALSFVAPNSRKVDVNASSVVWTGYKVTGKHTGAVKIKSGEIMMEDGKLTGGSFEMDMASMTCTDMQGEYADKLMGHLKSDDFFGTAKYPTAKMTITRVLPQDSKGNYKLVGNLTIKETTKEVKFYATVTENAGTVSASGKITVDRSEYDVRYGSGSFFDGLGDKTIYDEFDLQVSLVAK
jgi:polyisoprenoid-binding protein YceI